MPITKAKITSALLGHMHRSIKPLRKEFFDTIVDGTFTHDESTELEELIDKLRAALSDIYQALDLVWQFSAGSVVVAFQRLTITSDELSTTDAANDTLTTNSETDIEFNWTDPRRLNRVVLSPGEGVRPLDLRFDMVFTDLPSLQGTVYARGANELQLRTWNGTTFDGSSFDAGWVIDMVQIIPAGLSEL